MRKEDLQFLELSVTHFVTLDQPLSIPVPQFPYQYKLEITLVYFKISVLTYKFINTIPKSILSDALSIFLLRNSRYNLV